MEEEFPVDDESDLTTTPGPTLSTSPTSTPTPVVSGPGGLQTQPTATPTPTSGLPSSN